MTGQFQIGIFLIKIPACITTATFKRNIFLSAFSLLFFFFLSPCVKAGTTIDRTIDVHVSMFLELQAPATTSTGVMQESYVSVKVRDIRGHGIPNATVRFAVNAPATIDSEVKSGLDGVATAKLTIGDNPGDYTVVVLLDEVEAVSPSTFNLELYLDSDGDNVSDKKDCWRFAANYSSCYCDKNGELVTNSMTVPRALARVTKEHVIFSVDNDKDKVPDGCLYYGLTITSPELDDSLYLSGTRQTFTAWAKVGLEYKTDKIVWTIINPNTEAAFASGESTEEGGSAVIDLIAKKKIEVKAEFTFDKPTFTQEEKDNNDLSITHYTTAVIYAVEMDVVSVEYSDYGSVPGQPNAGDFVILKNDAKQFSAKKWEKQSGATTIQRSPSAFVRNTKLPIIAKFRIKCDSALPDTIGNLEDIHIIGTGNDGISGPDEEYSFNSWDEDNLVNTLTYNYTNNSLTMDGVLSSRPLPDYVTFIKDFTISWKVDIANAENERNIGDTNHEMYLLLNKPIDYVLFPRERFGGGLFDSALFIGSTKVDGSEYTEADGIINETKLLEAVWSHFNHVDRKGVSERDYNIANNTYTTKLLTYYSTTRDRDSVSEIFQQMLQTSEGRCGHWARLFSEIIGSHGLKSEIHRLVLPAGSNCPIDPIVTKSLLVKNWTFTEHINASPNGVLDTTPAGDDEMVLPVGSALYSNTIVLSAINIDQYLQTPMTSDYVGGDDVKKDCTADGTRCKYVDSGINGVSESKSKNDANGVNLDNQNIPYGEGSVKAFPAIFPGDNKIIDSQVVVNSDGTPKDIRCKKSGTGCTIGSAFDNSTWPYCYYYTNEKYEVKTFTIYEDNSNHPYKDVYFDSSILSQNNSDPPHIFIDHAIVKVKHDSKYYDPSYGTGPKDSIIILERESFSGYTAKLTNPGDKSGPPYNWDGYIFLGAKEEKSDDTVQDTCNNPPENASDEIKAKYIEEYK